MPPRPRELVVEAGAAAADPRAVPKEKPPVLGAAAGVLKTGKKERNFSKLNHISSQFMKFIC